MKSKNIREDFPSDSKKKRPKAGKARLDVLLVERGLAPSRERAQAMLLAGQVLVNSQKIEKPGSQVALDAQIEITGAVLRYASRGGVKLEGALRDFSVKTQDKICLDLGSSTGGFTDCLLQHGARRVYAVDVTVNQLNWNLRQDARVKLIERNARYLRAEDVAEPVELVVVDVSFISVTKILPAVVQLAAAGGEFLILIKPQFELEKRDVGKGGIVRDAGLHERAIMRVRRAVQEAGLEIFDVKPSHLQGAEGNQEFFLHARRRG
jgi:23S rRNA (cytidine1920-2'-O)/16S rRNA (cytidine1409-2'-O)-methyltransferase